MELVVLVLAAAIVVAAFILARRPGLSLAPDQALEGLQSRLDQTSAALASLGGAFEERRGLEERSIEAIARIERLFAGSFSKGKTGENLLAAVLSEFPPEMLVRDFRVGGRVCEFALVMTNGKLMPVDSKWTAVDQLANLDGATDGPAMEQLRRTVEKTVAARVKEVAGYIDPSLTVPMAIAAVPDSVYACCKRVHADARDLRVTIVPYSTAVPVLLSIWNLHRTYSREVDSEALLARVHDVSMCLHELGERLEGHLSRALKTAGNAVFEMRSLVAGAQASLAAIQRDRHEDEPMAPVSRLPV